MNKSVIGALTGLAFLIVAILSFVIMGDEPPEAGDGAQEIVDYYTDNKDSIQIANLLAGIAGALLVYFGAYLRKTVADAEGAGGWLSAIILTGTAVLAIGIAIDATISFALAEAAEDIEPASAQTLQALWDNDFIPLAMGNLLFLSSVGLSIVKTGVLPKWIGWVAIVLAVANLTPAGFVSFLIGALLIAVISVMLAMRARDEGAQTA